MAHTVSPVASAPDSGRWRLPSVLTVTIAAIMQLVVLVPFTVSSGLMAPLWAIIALYALWVIGAVLLVLTAHRRPLVTPVIPIVNAALWMAAMTGGERLLGWVG